MNTTPSLAKPRFASPAAARRSVIASWIHPGFRRAGPPVILIGMHRSGTSLVAGLLRRLGAFMGPDCQVPGGGPEDATLVRLGYGESAAFRRCNDGLLRTLGAAWDHPEPFVTRMAARERSLASRLARETWGSLRRGYLAPQLRQPGVVWGWKDPRNALTLPAWLDLFPEARVIHIRRDPAAAARSLHRRSTEEAEEARTHQGPLPAKERMLWYLQHPGEAAERAVRKLVGNPVLPPNRSTTDFDHCLQLADTYNRACKDARSLACSWMEVDYESVVADPHAICRNLADFSGLKPEPATLHHAASLVIPRSCR